jgi:hypothetical protein
MGVVERVRSFWTRTAISCAIRRKGTLPNTSSSPTSSDASSTRSPFTKVPLLEPRSETRTPAPVEISFAWRREIVGSKIGMSLLAARPTSSVEPSGSSNDWAPLVETILKAMPAICAMAGWAGEG